MSRMLVIVTAAALAAPVTAQQAPPTVERFTVPRDRSVNSWIIDAPEGLIVVDVQRDRASAERLIERTKARIKAGGRPLSAVLLTHAHPDHIGGLDQFARAFPAVPVHASRATAEEIRTDGRGFQKMTRALGPNAPRAFPVPGRVFADGQTLTVAGLTIAPREFGPGESVSATSYHLLRYELLFGGDIATAGMEDFLMEGRTGPWLLQVQVLR